jgi:prevent-host-death family protein
MDDRVTIGQVKRDISDLVNRVAFGGKRIILTSRGKPKAALVSMKDYEKLLEEQPSEQARLIGWGQHTKELAGRIRERRSGSLIDVDGLQIASREELEQRNAWITGSN